MNTDAPLVIILRHRKLHFLRQRLQTALFISLANFQNTASTNKYSCSTGNTAFVFRQILSIIHYTIYYFTTLFWSSPLLSDENVISNLLFHTTEHFAIYLSTCPDKLLVWMLKGKSAQRNSLVRESRCSTDEMLPSQMRPSIAQRN